jgi:hypothetical protein
LGCRLGGAEHLDPGGGEVVGEAGHQRHLGSHHHQIDSSIATEADDGRMVGHIEPHAFGDLGDAGIAGRAIELAEERACRHRPRQRVLASAGADEENVHQRNPAKGLESRP